MTEAPILLVREITTKIGANIPSWKEMLAFAKFGHVLTGYIFTVSNVDVEKRFIREPYNYVRKA